MSVVNKSKFVGCLTSLLKGFGVYVKKGSRSSQSPATFWELYRLIKAIEVAVTIASGNRVSLAGVGQSRLALSARGDAENPKLRYRWKPSSNLNKFLDENQEYVQSFENSLIPDEDFVWQVQEILQKMGYDESFLPTDVVEVLECD